MVDKTLELNNPETYVLAHNSFNTYLVSICSDLRKSQIYKKPFRVSSHDEIDILMSFFHLKVFKPIEHIQDYHSRKTDNEYFLFEIEDKIYIYVGEKN